MTVTRQSSIHRIGVVAALGVISVTALVAPAVLPVSVVGAAANRGGVTSNLTGAGLVASGATPSDRGEPTPVAHVWVTTPDRQLVLSDQGTVPFTTARTDQLTITVDPSRTFQTMQGF